jgi:hypothetical protein
MSTLDKKKINKNNKNNKNNINKINKKNKIIDVNNSESTNSEDITDSIIKTSLEYFDNYQPSIQNFINNINYIKIIDKININDEYVFYDFNDKKIFSSKIEILSIYIPQTKTWKWSWSIPFAKYKNTLVSREILNYAFTLNSENDLFLKSTLVNSKIIIKNEYQLDIYLAISSLLSKKPFILRIYLLPWEELNNNNINGSKNNSSNDSDSNISNDPDEIKEYIYHYKKINDDPNIKKNYISVFLLIVDWNI